MKEIWKYIPQSDNKYLVSNMGQIFSCKNNIVLRQSKDKDGYCVVSLSKQKNKRMFKVHRLVLEAFIGPPSSPKIICRHLDGNPSNNKLENLKWGTQQENKLDQILHGTDFKGEKNPKAKLNIEDVRIIYYMIYMQCPDNIIAKNFNVDTPCIYKIRNKITWKHLNDMKLFN